jgi:CHASE2 domain-containing sensor protein
MKKIEKSTIYDFTLGLSLTLITLLLFLLVWAPLESLEEDLYDLRSWISLKATSAPIAVVSIDDASIAKMGRWPWPRAYIGSMVICSMTIMLKSSVWILFTPRKM